MKLGSIDQQQIAIIRQAELFEGLSDDTLKAIIEDDRCHYEHYEKGDIICSPASCQHAIGLIVKGEVSAVNDSGYLMRRLTPSQIFGVAGLFEDDDSYVSTIAALTDCELITLEEELICDSIAAYDEFALNYARFLTGRIRFLNKRIALMTSSSNTGKLLLYLMNEAQQQGNDMEIALSYSQLSQSLNMARSSLYRALDELEKENIIIRDGKNIRLLQFERRN